MKELDTTLRKKEDFKISRALMHGIVSSFCGCMTGLTVSVFHPKLALPSAGLSGWLGSETFEMASKFLSNRYGK